MAIIRRFSIFLKAVLGFLVFFAAAHFILTRIHREPFFSFNVKRKLALTLPALPKPKQMRAHTTAPAPRRQAARVKGQPRILPRAVEHPRIAIVLDDWGYSTRNVELARSIEQPLTIAVLPNLRYSFTVSRVLYEGGHEIILHLPMEAQGALPQEEDTLLVAHNAAQVRSIMNRGLESVRYALGVSNHTGSRATEDRSTMTIVLGELKKRGLYFLDSYVTGDSKGAEVSRSIGLRYAQRDIFLDNTDDAAYIRTQILKLKDKADLQGEAIGIGHDRRTTLEVLREMMPQLESQGYEFVFVSDLLKE